MRKFNIGWGLTSKCNMNCEFCYSKETRNKSLDISIVDWKRFVDENHEQIDSINYGTGENALLDDFFWFIDYVRAKYPFIKQSVTTNGFITQRILKNDNYHTIFMRALDEVDISLDFADKKKHCDFRGQQYAYDWAIQTLKYLHGSRIKVTIVFVGFEETLKKENIDGLFEIAKEYDAMIRLNIYRPVSDAKPINDKFKLSYRTLFDSLRYINYQYRIIGLSDILIANLFSDESNVKENTGIGSIRILPDGKICPSTYLISEDYSSMYSIRDKNVLRRIHFDAFENAVIPEQCAQCIIKERCRGGVYDRRILWYGTLLERDPYCPTRYGESVPSEKFSVEAHGRISVHDEYLPTLFFSYR